MRKELGFSVLETLSIVLTVAILAAIAVPRVVKATRTHQLRFAAQQVAQLIHTAKFDAVSKNTKQKISLNIAHQTITTTNGRALTVATGIGFAALPNDVPAPEVVQTAAQNSEVLVAQEGDARSAVSLPAGIFPDTYELTFTPRGLPDVEPGVVHWIYLVNDTGERMAVTMTSAGSVTVLTLRDGQWS